MSIYQCPKGHSSTEPDYCSECGTKIQGTPVPTITVETRNTKSLQITCPACTAPHNPSSGDFCEICGYNFVTKTHGEVPPLEEGSRGVGEQGNTQSLEIIAIVDPSLRSPESPEAPVQQPITFKLDKESNLIGRNSTLRGVYPEVALDFDSAVSQRHALLNRQPDGTFILRDIGSTNGTKLNGVELTPMVDVPIKDGDEFTLGHWTRLKLRSTFKSY
ncbi:FHA domain-containing protein [Iningainema tapete]|uniref:FHA domain-containing protein n=1 Tax=Iningainema tapete BLCC-T55 TaxID=2748662 RepID=A0A8J6XW51_9CYAN|nr:FHA domain-containing protein [Iningainema tapete]MBD2777412.1 FHA domain-containing protein [Iningainema tapete BLCC-T55]